MNRKLTFTALFTFVLLVAVMASWSDQARSVPQPVPQDWSMTAENTATRSELAAENPPILSGAVQNELRATYTASATFMDADSGEFHFTVDGSNPGPNNPSTITKQMDTDEDPNVDQPTITYTSNITLAELAPAPEKVTIKFFVVVCETAPAPLGGCETDNNNGNFYKYVIDKSVPQFTQLSLPVPPPTSTVGFPVVDTNTPPISFHVTDSQLGTPIQTSVPDVRVLVNSADRTSDFTKSQISNFEYSFVFNYPGGFSFAEGQHAIEVILEDAGGNRPPLLRFAVDQTDPSVTSVQSVPNTFVKTADGTLVTAKGATVNVSATVTDPHVDLNGTTNVLGTFVNGTGTSPIASAPFTLRFNETTEKWENQTAVIPAAFGPAGEFRFHVEVAATDAAGNVGTGASPENMTIDPEPPTIVDEAPPDYIPVGPLDVRAEVTDEGSGVDDSEVIIFFAISGNWTGEPPEVEQTQEGVFFDNMVRGQGNNFTYTIPEAADEAVLTYFIEATDQAGGTSTSPLRTVIVDGTEPLISEEPRVLYRGAAPYVFEVEVVDTGSGVDAGNASVFYSIDGGNSFVKAPLVDAGEEDDLWRATVEDLALDEGDTLSYYYEVFDEVGNRGELGNETNLLESIIDLTAPSFSLTAPANATGPEFEITWSGSDPNLAGGGQGSGVASYSIFARVEGQTDWVLIFNATDDTQADICAVSGKTYEFNGFATDNAGNSGDLGDDPLGATTLTGPSCPQELIVTVIQPGTQGARFDAQGGSAALNVQWSATTTRILTPDETHSIDILFSPDNGRAFYTVASDLENDGVHQLPMELPSCTSCFIKVQATTVDGTTAEDTSPVFTIVNGDKTVDLDGNGLPDDWEIKYMGQLGVAQPSVDADGDGLSNRREAQHGTDPTDPDTDGDTYEDGLEVKVGTDPLDPQSVPTEEQARVQQWTHWYWSVPAMFGVAAIIYFIGLARRW